MPKAARSTSGPTGPTNRKEPYPKTSPKSQSAPDKENVDPQPKSKPKSKSKAGEAPTFPQGDYRDIPLDEVKNEVPCYDNAATVRRKLKKLLGDKSTIPGTSRKWSQASMTAEMQELENRGHPVEYNRNAINGPTASSLSNFLKKSGNMGGGDSPCYYWGYVMLEKLRIYNGEKKSKPRQKAEEEFPGGHCREDHTKRRLLCQADNPPPDGWDPEARGPEDDEKSKSSGVSPAPIQHACAGPSERCYVCAPNLWSSDPRHRPGRHGPVFYTSGRPGGSPLAPIIPLDPDTVYAGGDDERALDDN